MKGSENALLTGNLLNVTLNYLSKHSIPNCLYVYSDVGGVISSFTPLMHKYAELYAQKCAPYKKSGENPDHILIFLGAFYYCII